MWRVLNALSFDVATFTFGRKKSKAIQLTSPLQTVKLVKEPNG